MKYYLNRYVLRGSFKNSLSLWERVGVRVFMIISLILPFSRREKEATAPHFGNFAIISFFLLLLLPETASAAGEISGIICTVANSLTGATGKAIATAALIFVGLGALFNKASWGVVLSLGLGIALIFGASSFMSAIGYTETCTATPSAAFSCSGGNAVGNLFDDNPLDPDPARRNKFAYEQGASKDVNAGVFGRTLYVFRDTVGNVMSSMYCSMTDSLRGPINVAITLFLIVFGITIATGIVKLTIKEAGVIIFKIALVWAFALDPAWGIGIGYKFFMGFAENASDIVIKTIPHAAGPMPTLTTPDRVLSGIFGAVTNGGGQGNISPQLNVPAPCFGIIVLMALFLLLLMPFLVVFVVLLIIQFIGLYARALIGYLSAVVLITFLFVFAPFFLGFALFKSTNDLFQAWIKNLITFSIQMVIMFGFLAFMSLIPVGHFFVQILNLLQEYDLTVEIPMTTIPIHFCGVCDYKILSSTEIACINHAGSTVAQAEDAGFMMDVDQKFWLRSLLNLIMDPVFAQFLVANAMALFIIGKVVEDMLKKAPQIAKSLGGLPSAAALGGSDPKSGTGGLQFAGYSAIQGGYLGLKNQLNNTGNIGQRIKFLATTDVKEA
ncbi:MAG: TrbC/VirB2 family protein, partial [Pseudomonadota bacterium]